MIVFLVPETLRPRSQVTEETKLGIRKGVGTSCDNLVDMLDPIIGQLSNPMNPQVHDKSKMANPGRLQQKLSCG